MIKTALISVSDKTGIIEFAQELVKRGVKIISTGGTHKALEGAGIEVIGISDVTGFPECLDGRVKTLHPKIHAGLLSVRSNPDHMAQIKELGVDTIDMVVVNLYPFKKTISKPGVQLEEAIENIDIGGPSMLRSAAKNYAGVVVLTDPSDYAGVLKEWDEDGDVSYDTRFYLANKVFEHTSYYDTMIAAYMNKQRGDNSLKNTLTLTFEKVQDMRYGENPHQKAAFYREIGDIPCSLVSAKQLHGKELSYNNINDANAALEILREFNDTGKAAVVAIKHANPCGVAVADTIFDAYTRAYEADPVSIFGGIVAANREIDADTAKAIGSIFLEIVIAPSYTKEALEIIEAKKNIRILELPEIATDAPSNVLEMKKVLGGLLVQDADRQLIADGDMANVKTVTDKKPTDAQLETMLFGMKIAKHTKSNAIVLVKDNCTVGIGPGQTNRVGALEIAIRMAGDKAKGSILASDAFFPFSDCVEAAHAAGIEAIVQPGGSIRDQDSIDACNKYGIPMVFTGARHFKH